MRARVLISSTFVLLSGAIFAMSSGCPFSSGNGVVSGLAGNLGGTSFNLAPNVVLSADLSRGIAPLTVRFSSAESTDDGLIVDRVWDFGDGTTAREISPTHTYESTGLFTVRLTLTDDGTPSASASRTTQILVTEAPIARISVDRTSSETAPAVFVFDATASSDPDAEAGAPNNGIVSYSWSFGDGTTEVLPAVAHTYSRPGTFRAVLTVTDEAGVQGKALVIIDVGIARPTVQFLTPPVEVQNIVVPLDAPLWTHVEFSVEQGVPRFLRAGLDRDQDQCEAQAPVYDTASGAELAVLIGHENRVNFVGYSPDGLSILTASDDETLRLHDAATGELILSYSGNGAAVTAAAWAPDGAQFALGLASGEIILRDADTGAVVQSFNQHTGAVNALAFSPLGGQLASTGADRRVLVWDVAGATVLQEYVGHELSVTDVAFGNNRLVTASVDGTARVWDAVSGEELVRFTEHNAPVYAAALTLDETQVISGGGDQRALLWNIADGTLEREFVGHTDAISSLAISPDGTLLATGSRDWTAKIWDAATAVVQRSLAPCSSTISSISFSADGAALALAIRTSSDIQLDTTQLQGNDMNLTAPQALDLQAAGVEPGVYFLWAEVDTDRTQPARTYAPTLVQVTTPFTQTVSNDTPRIALLNDRAAVVVAPSVRRQIFDVGELQRGDRVFLSYMRQPGFDGYYEELEFPSTVNEALARENEGSEIDGYHSLMMLDRDSRMLVWYQGTPDPNAPQVYFTPDARIIVGENSSSHYIATDTASSVLVEIERMADLNLTDEEVAARLSPRQQRVYLDFNGGVSVNVANEVPIYAQSFDSLLSGLYPDPDDIELRIKPALVQRLRNIVSGYDIQISTSDEGPPPEQPYQTLYFSGAFTTVANNLPSAAAPYILGNGRIRDLGRADYVDPRNETATGTAIVGVTGILDATGTLSPTLMGLALGNATAHEMGFLLGLRRTEDSTLASDDIMDLVQLWDDGAGNLGKITTTEPIFTESSLRSIEQFNIPALGTQDAAGMFEQLFGED